MDIKCRAGLEAQAQTQTYAHRNTPAVQQVFYTTFTMAAFSRMVIAATMVPAVLASIPILDNSECQMCYDTGYEQGQLDCEPDTTGAVTSDPHVSGLQKQRYALHTMPS